MLRVIFPYPIIKCIIILLCTALLNACGDSELERGFREQIELNSLKEYDGVIEYEEDEFFYWVKTDKMIEYNYLFVKNAKFNEHMIFITGHRAIRNKSFINALNRFIKYLRKSNHWTDHIEIQEGCSMIYRDLDSMRSILKLEEYNLCFKK